MGPVAVHLDGEPRTSPEGTPTIMLTGRVRNLSDSAIDTQVYMSELLVDGVPWPNWSLAIGNGTIDARLVELLPGDEASFARELDASALSGAPHTVVLKVLGVESNPVRL
jgi:hypothetical protein